MFKKGKTESSKNSNMASGSDTADLRDALSSYISAPLNETSIVYPPSKENEYIAEEMIFHLELHENGENLTPVVEAPTEVKNESTRTLRRVGKFYG